MTVCVPDGEGEGCGFASWVSSELGLELDVGMSAWRKGAKRPGWERLLARLESGESDGVCVWHVDRLFRQPKDLESQRPCQFPGHTNVPVCRKQRPKQQLGQRLQL